MDIVLLVKLSDKDKAIVYHPCEQQEYMVSVSSDQMAVYRVMLSYAKDHEDVYVVLDREKNQLTFVNDWKNIYKLENAY